MKVKSVAILGPESSGKSTLAEQLGLEFNAMVVPEYAREYFQKNRGEYTFQDLEEIAQNQVKRWFGAILQQPEMLILDTELTVIKVWSEMKYGKVSPWIQKHYVNQKIDLYLLCDYHLPWTPDPLREHPRKEDRELIFESYKKLMIEEKRNFAIVSGNGKQRLNNAVEIIQKHFSN